MTLLEQYTFLSSVEPVPARITSLKHRITDEKDPQTKATLERQLASNAAYLEQVQETKVTPPSCSTSAADTQTRSIGSRHQQTSALRKQGLSADAASAKIDVTKYRTEFPSVRGVGIDAAGVRRIYQLTGHPEPAL